jgi:hypothetical protein
MSRVYDFGLGGQFPDSSTKFPNFCSIPVSPEIGDLLGSAHEIAGLIGKSLENRLRGAVLALTPLYISWPAVFKSTSQWTPKK